MFTGMTLSGRMVDVGKVGRARFTVVRSRYSYEEALQWWKSEAMLDLQERG